ncbi:major facilitator superfamily domain-containing protein [Lentinula raphanica]|uniref:Major facilitator superfamily domain-containing protein n=1 Tax=Lentinula raphanica TaxID=153919 RepID=A0AA38P3Q8_9AGAR|nr:major facilitator superfamily domain-containing protein [Lentinula raphanica]KAJ3835763.1 major facilitator superfamily domain-containing protein [Lentinula raphanica]KAJ3968417.1 major facilitator superfamily domain-containing protein [Lentinula raphanica]
MEKEYNESSSFDYGFLPIPKHLRYTPGAPLRFSIARNAAFGICTTFVVANLYYSQPLLIQLSLYFDVSYEEISRVPTLLQAGYATGVVFVSPLGDLVPRRPLLLVVVLTDIMFTLGLALTHSAHVFEALSFVVGVTSVAPQILTPFAADLAPENRRASTISIIFAGLLFGILVARVLSGIVAEFSTWRIIYYIDVGLLAAVLVTLYFVVPEHPAKNKDLTYLGILTSMLKLSTTEPVLIQASLITLGSNACYMNFWVTLTFILGGSPYHYSTLVIGLFGLIGMFGVSMGPILGRGIDRLVTWYAILIPTFCMVIFWSIQTAAAGVNISAIVIVCIGLDLCDAMQQVSLSTAVFSISESARARLNAVLILSNFIGQFTGTAAATKVYIEHGWRASAALGLACAVFQLLLLFVRGPHCERYTWLGYQGGWEWKKIDGEHNDDDKETSDIQ